jgi:hypothetical protein
MKPSALVGGLVAAMTLASAAQAGSIDIVYWGKDSGATLVVDGQTYSLRDADDWVTIKSIESGQHSLTLYSNGTSMNRDFTLSYDNADTKTGANGLTWCMSLDDEKLELLDVDNCDDMMAYYFGG